VTQLLIMKYLVLLIIIGKQLQLPDEDNPLTFVVLIWYITSFQ